MSFLIVSLCNSLCLNSPVWNTICYNQFTLINMKIIARIRLYFVFYIVLWSEKYEELTCNKSIISSNLLNTCTGNLKFINEYTMSARSIKLILDGASHYVLVLYLQSICFRLPKEKWLRPNDLLELLDKDNYKLGLIIDLTNTARYYKPEVCLVNFTQTYVHCNGSVK